MTIIDSHHHLWKYSSDEYGWINEQMLPLKSDFLLPELREVAATSSIDGFVSVQARQSLQETTDLLAMADLEPLIRGVVGWVPLAASDVNDTLERLAEQKRLKSQTSYRTNPTTNSYWAGIQSWCCALASRTDPVYSRQLPPRSNCRSASNTDDSGSHRKTHHQAWPIRRQLGKGHPRASQGKHQL